MKILLLLTLIVSTSVFSNDLEESLAQYRVQADMWQKERNSISDCNETIAVKIFLLKAINLNSAQISEDNSLFIEELAISNPDCLRSVFANSTEKEKNDIYRHFFTSPAFKLNHDYGNLINGK